MRHNNWVANSNLYMLLSSFELMYHCTNTLTEQFFEGNVLLRHLLNEGTLFMSWQRSAIRKVNDWAQGVQKLQNNGTLWFHHQWMFYALCTIFTILLTFFGKSYNAHILHASGVYYSYMVSGPIFEFRKVIHNFWHQDTFFRANSGIYKNVSRVVKIVHSAMVVISSK